MTSLPSPPLRAHRVSFPAVRSSLSNAHLGGRGAATYDCCCACTFVFASDARGGFHRCTQARASSLVDCFKFSTNSCFCIIVKVSRAERPRGSQRGYPCRKTAILIVTIKRWLSPRSFTRPPVGIPCGLLSAQSGEGRAYHVSRQSQDCEGLALTPVALMSTT